MVSEDAWKKMANIFDGDVEGFYSYKTGPVLIRFFNDRLGFDDRYGQGFPSRWVYVVEKLQDMIGKGTIDRFFSISLSVSYLMQDLDCTEVEALESSNLIKAEYLRILRPEGYTLTGKNSDLHLVALDQDLRKIGEGGFADVFHQVSTGLAVKKLKTDFAGDRSIRSRFRREFSIMESLQDLPGVLRVYDFDEGSCSYTMELAETTLAEYLDPVFPDATKMNCIRQVFATMKEVHRRGVLHRDISPSNVFILQGMIKIGDFGLGKDLNVLTSYQTLNTNQVGQLMYCAPEQLLLLREGDSRSDVFSLGRLVDFIMTGSPRDKRHFLRSVCEKAEAENSERRYADAGEMLEAIENAVALHDSTEREDKMLQAIEEGTFDQSIEAWIFEMNEKTLCGNILSVSAFRSALEKFSSLSDGHAEFVVDAINSGFRDACGRSFEANDAFAYVAFDVLEGAAPFHVKEQAAEILEYIAHFVNRFNAQRLIDMLVEQGIDPTLEDVLARR